MTASPRTAVPSAPLRARVEADLLADLDRWFDRALGAASVADVFVQG